MNNDIHDLPYRTRSVTCADSRLDRHAPNIYVTLMDSVEKMKLVQDAGRRARVTTSCSSSTGSA
jgi:hypothetical protein